MIPPLIINSSRIEKVAHEDWILSPDAKLSVDEETENMISSWEMNIVKVEHLLLPRNSDYQKTREETTE